MSLQNELKALLYVIPRLLKDFWEDERNMARHYTNIIAVVCLLLVVGMGAYIGYRWHTVSREQTVQRALVAHLEEFQRVSAGAKDLMMVQLAQLESALSFDYGRYSSSAIAPLFLLLQADVQLKEGKQVEALNTLQRVIGALPTNVPLLYLIKTKRALMQLDSSDESTQQLGLKELEQLARDAKNTEGDLALFYLGRYYWVHDKLENAKAIWKELLDTAAYTRSFPSPWAYEAQEALAQTGE